MPGAERPLLGSPSWMSSVEDSMESKCRGHKRGDIEDTEGPDDDRRQHPSSESNDHVRTGQSFLASTELRATPPPYAVSPPVVGRQQRQSREFVNNRIVCVVGRHVVPSFSTVKPGAAASVTRRA